MASDKPKKPILHDSKASAPIIMLKNPNTLAVWRCTGRYADELPYYKIGSKVYYDEADLLAFLESRRVGGK